MKKRIVEILIAASLSCIFAACSSPTNGETGGTDCPDCGGFGKKSSSSNVPMSSSDGVEISSSSNALMISWIKTGKFWISQTEITQADYRTLMGTLPQQMTKSVGDSFPVANVSWYEAILFANALSKYLGLDTAFSYTLRGVGNKLGGLKINDRVSAVRLPSREEWEFAARAGSTGNYYWGANPARDYAQYNNLTDGYQKIAQKKPNAWELYDVCGNVAEWALDTALHGGAWNSVAKELAFRASEKKLPDFASNTSGFRVVWIGE